MARKNRSELESKRLDFQPLSAFRRRNFGTILICEKSEIENVNIERFKHAGQKWHTVNVDASAVFTYSREPLNGRELYLCSLGAALDVQLSNGQRRQKSAEFKRSVKSIIAWIKERCAATCKLNGFGYPATPAVKAALRKKTIELRL
jgi:hypothetical protein